VTGNVTSYRGCWLLGAFWQRDGEVRHLIAGQHLEDLTPLLGRLALSAASRDFLERAFAENSRQELARDRDGLEAASQIR